MNISYPKSASGKALLIRLDESGSTRLIERPKKADELRVKSGKKKNITRRMLHTLARRVVRSARSHNASVIAIEYSDFVFAHLDLSDEEIGSLLAQNFCMADFEFRKFKTAPKDGWKSIQTIEVQNAPAEAKRGFSEGLLIGEYVNHCRELADSPAGDMTPKILAREARALSKGLPITVRSFGRAQLTKMKMGAVLGVAKGSREEPQFIVMEYTGGAKNEKPIVFIGKGVTFDTGGINIKTGDSSLGMHLDMSGGAAVIAAIALIARLEVKRNVVALIPAVENMTAGESYRPGDILRSLSGKTIEVINTDAEGRVILADALTYAERYKPQLVVDVATLTGGSLAALGQQANAFFATDDELRQKIWELSEESGDYAWPLPLWSEYEALIKSSRADLANLATKGNTRYGDVTNAAAFLWQFAKKYPWVHIDIAPRMTTVPSDELAAGAAGSPVRLLYRIANEYRE
ncbi:leucyl aminopeptidase [Candidatus Kaiserbacteria bacterium CG10_big_fil_rev_8_21_14_0_10_49_17]|uniref:Leucyl aminopeptidase n=1 Tax=Candidatus Kaiserbacteria bacterium CG10_big_fil_rev_8_21_14_0_10_49_17 TaxID=1974609 RepID=A0A2M6WF43_9BACT|nr:MAG: leucyl aminopeptidase [Candidatus Kaiserbacteria bacterium CG10_big_fil_rev_8_21_14_0_10_49_17]